MGNLISDFSRLLKQEATRIPSGQHALDKEYYKRIEAVQFTMSHDDGKIINDIDKSDVILMGISRTSKTPTAIYLANRGYKVSNIPIIPNKDLSDDIIKRSKIIFFKIFWQIKFNIVKIKFLISINIRLCIFVYAMV